MLHARELGEEICARLRAEPCRTRGPLVPVTASIGVHVLDADADGQAADVALQVVDAALYAAKSRGRNRVEAAQG